MSVQKFSQTCLVTSKKKSYYYFGIIRMFLTDIKVFQGTFIIE